MKKFKGVQNVKLLFKKKVDAIIWHVRGVNINSVGFAEDNIHVYCSE